MEMIMKNVKRAELNTKIASAQRLHKLFCCNKIHQNIFDESLKNRIFNT